MKFQFNANIQKVYWVKKALALKNKKYKILKIMSAKTKYKLVKTNNIYNLPYKVFKFDTKDKTCCKICNSKAYKIFTKKILNKYDVNYYQCSNCGAIFTQEPYWLNEAYSDAITSSDIGILSRNINIAKILENIIYNNFDKNRRFLDYGGGYGILTRLMRDKGFEFYLYDKYCENLFAKHFKISDLQISERFEFVSAFEVLEHASNVLELLTDIFKITDNFIFTTELNNIAINEDWWYFAPEHGQHIMFYTYKSLELLAKKFNKNFYTNGFIHAFSNNNDFSFEKYYGKRLPTLLVKDFDFIKYFKIN